MEIAEIKHVVEAALLGAGRPLSLDQLGELFAAGSGDVERKTIRAALQELGNDYQGRGIELREVASGYRIQIRQSMTSRLAPLWEQRAPRYSRAMLETLALIAYRQPVTRGDIEQVRGVSVGTNMVRTLLERGWIRVVGRRDVPGRPALYATTREFLDYFGLKKLDDLPPLSEIRDLDDLNVALELPEPGPQAELPVQAAPEDTDAIDTGG
ncbi:MAG: SMC-Scp complex subunit ScpB [Rhodospirillaceae bacterium]|nr:SMC-Scp complex subunit ScpB [Rhodospirillaceae bacterium]MDE0000519.1 SMC-Scp complex subunit ScpB [Rhodospirillaceae bacterium]